MTDLLAFTRISPNLIQNLPARAACENFLEICLCAGARVIQFAPLPTRYLWPHMYSTSTAHGTGFTAQQQTTDEIESHAGEE